MVDATSSGTRLQDPIWGKDELREKMEKNTAFLKELRRQMGCPDKGDSGSGDE